MVVPQALYSVVLVTCSGKILTGGFQSSECWHTSQMHFHVTGVELKLFFLIYSLKHSLPYCTDLYAENLPQDV